MSIVEVPIPVVCTCADKPIIKWENLDLIKAQSYGAAHKLHR